MGVSNEELRNLSYQKRCYLLNKNSVLVTRHIQYKVEVFFEEIILDDKTKYYATRITFQERSHSHVYSFIWIFNTPNIQNEDVYFEFLEKTINVQLSDHLNDPDPLELVVKTYQGHAHSKLAASKTRMDVDFPTVDILLIRQSLKPLGSKFSDDESEVLTWTNTLLKKVKSYVDDNLDTAK